MKQIFYDPRQRRRKVIRRIIDLSLIGLTIVLAIFFFSVLSRQNLPELLLPTQKRNYRALHERQPDLLRRNGVVRPARRRTQKHPSDIVLNQDEGLRAAFYVNDEADYSALKAHIHQIDMLFPDWLHLVAPDGNLMAATPEFPVHFYNVVDAAGVHGVDPQNKVATVIEAAKEDTLSLT